MIIGISVTKNLVANSNICTQEGLPSIPILQFAAFLALLMQVFHSFEQFTSNSVNQNFRWKRTFLLVVGITELL